MPSRPRSQKLCTLVRRSANVVGVVSARPWDILIRPLFSATKTLPSEAKRTVVGLVSPENTVVYRQPSGSVAARAGPEPASRTSARRMVSRTASRHRTAEASLLSRIGCPASAAGRPGKVSIRFLRALPHLYVARGSAVKRFGPNFHPSRPLDRRRPRAADVRRTLASNRAARTARTIRRCPLALPRRLTRTARRWTLHPRPAGPGGRPSSRRSPGPGRSARPPDRSPPLARAPPGPLDDGR
jgi:hypothetical protein